MWTSGRAEDSPSSCLVGADIGLEIVMRQRGKRETQHPEEAAAERVCARMRVCVCARARVRVRVGWRGAVFRSVA